MIEKSWGARSQMTSTSAWTSPGYAHRVVVAEAPDVARLHQVADLGDRARVAEGVVGHQDRTGGVGHLGDGATGLEARRQRLLDEHVLAGSDARLGDAGMGAGRGGDGDPVDVGVGEDLGEVAGDPLDAVPARQPGGAVGVEVTDPTDRGPLVVKLRTRFGPNTRRPPRRSLPDSCCCSSCVLIEPKG